MREVFSLEKLMEKYENQPVLRTLVQLVPCGIGSAIEVGVLTTLQNIRAERTRTFFEELASGRIELSPELLKSEDFLHCYFATTKAALNSRRREKIRLFARLLTASIIEGNFADTDEYEEYLQILDELSYREFLILLRLSEYEDRNQDGTKNDLELAELFWDDFRLDLKLELMIPDDDVEPCLIRLARTGCYELFMGKYWGVRDGEGKTTSRFHRLKDFVKGQ